MAVALFKAGIPEPWIQQNLMSPELRAALDATRQN
jgi:hypothetical protein